MRNTFEFDLSSIDNILERLLNRLSRRAFGVTYDVAISPSDIAALRARYYRGLDGIIRPLKRSSAYFTLD
jgi:hypothetical protein